MKLFFGVLVFWVISFSSFAQLAERGDLEKEILYGKIKTIIETENSNELTNKVVFAYELDSTQRQINCLVKDSQNVFQGFKKTTFDAKKRPTVIYSMELSKEYDENNVLIKSNPEYYKTVYEYNAIGKILNFNTYRKEGDFYVPQRNYVTDGKAPKIPSSDENYIFYKYDNLNRNTEQIMYEKDEQDKVTTKWYQKVYHYYDIKGNILKEGMIDPAGNGYKANYLYDVSGKLIQLKRYYLGASYSTPTQQQLNYYYNTKQHIEKIVKKDLITGKPLPTIYFEYVYDAKGNWTQRIMKKGDVILATLNRVIEYY